MPSPAHTLLALAVTACALLARLPAQEPPRESADPEITKLEEAFLSELKTIQEELGTGWLGALSKLQDDLTRSEKFAEAQLVRKEHQRVTAMLKEAPVLSSGDDEPVQLTSFELAPRDATLSGGLSLDDAMIGKWSKLSGTARWDMPTDTTPGIYELIIEYRCGGGAGGSFEISVGDEQTLSAKVAPPEDGNWDERSMLVGECLVDPHTGFLKMRATGLSGSSLMNLSGIAFAPQGTWEEQRSKAGGDSQFERIEGARWIDQDDQDNGVFRLSVGDEEKEFRLYFVEPVPAIAPRGGYARMQLVRTARSLRTTQDEILRYGAKVASSLREELEGQELTVLTRWETRGNDERYLAYILVGNRPLSLSLVEDGRARLGGPYATEAPFIEGERRAARAFMAQLKAAGAQARKNRLGLWGL